MNWEVMNWKLIRLIFKFGSEENPISAGRLGRMLAVEQDATHYPVRKEILECIRNGALIGSRPSGYYIMEKLDHLEENEKGLISRVKEINIRRKLLRRNWGKREDFYKVLRRLK